jgi:hypothetical protein
MKKLTGLLSILLLLMASCKKENNSAAVLNVPLPPAEIILASGTFISSAHVSSGKAKIIKDASNKIFLVFENFKTDGGPDLRVWLSPNNAANPYQEVGLLKATTGNFYYELDASFNYTANNRVLIWCKQFAVLFGYAVLQ